MLFSTHPLYPLFTYLETHSLVELRNEHGVRFNVKGHRVTLAYDQFEAKITNPISNLCRGLVIAKYDIFANPVVDVNVPFGEAQLLAFPMVRFFNYGQDQENQNGLKPVSIYEKLDGSMAIVYYDWDTSDWHVATRNVPDGSNQTDGCIGNKTFRQLFEKAILDNYGLDWKQFGDKLLIDATYVFELMTPENVVVVRHNEYKATLLAARASATPFAQELDIQKIAAETGFNIPQSYPELLNLSFDEIVKVANDRDPLKNEGFVLVTSDFQRMKIKSEKYVTYNKVHDLTNYDIVNYLLTGEIDDFVPLMADYQKKMVTDLSEKVSVWARNANMVIDELNAMNFDSKKSMAAFFNAPENQKKYKQFSRYAYHAFDQNRKIPEIQECVKQYRDVNTGRYSHGFLQTFLYDWLGMNEKV